MSSCEPQHRGELNLGVCCMYVCMYTRILISEVSVFRMFTSMPINGLP